MDWPVRMEQKEIKAWTGGTTRMGLSVEKGKGLKAIKG